MEIDTFEALPTKTLNHEEVRGILADIEKEDTPMLTVKDLIAKLQDYPPDLPVLVPEAAESYVPYFYIQTVRRETVETSDGSEDDGKEMDAVLLDYR